MSGFRGVMNGGWHPKGKEGGKESWRGDFKGINQVVCRQQHFCGFYVNSDDNTGRLDGKGQR